MDEETNISASLWVFSHCENSGLQSVFRKPFPVPTRNSTPALDFINLWVNMLVGRIGYGSSCEVRAIGSASNKVPVLDFLSSLDGSCKKTVGKMMRLLRESVPDQGPPRHNRERCRHLGEGIFEFKENQVRVLWFYDKDDGGIVVCTHGFLKKSQKTPPEEKRKARKLREQYENAKMHAEIIIFDPWSEEEHS